MSTCCLWPAASMVGIDDDEGRCLWRVMELGGGLGERGKNGWLCGSCGVSFGMIVAALLDGKLAAHRPSIRSPRPFPLRLDRDITARVRKRRLPCLNA